MDGEAPYLEVKVLLEEPEPMLRQEIEEALAGKKYRLARIVSAYRKEERVEKEVDGWKKGIAGNVSVADCAICIRKGLSDGNACRPD